MQHRPPGAGGRVAGETRGHDQEQRLLRGEHGERGQALQRPGVGPVDVLDNQQQRGGRARVRCQIAQGMNRAALARCGAHRSGERAQLGRGRDVEQVVEEEAPIGSDRPGGAGAFDRFAAGRLVARGGNAEQAARQGSHGITAGFGAEVENRGAVAGKAQRAGRCDEFGDHARLADAGIAAHDHDPAALALRARLGHGTKLTQLLVAPHQGSAAARRGRLPFPAHPVGDQRLLLALDLDRCGRVGLEEIRDLPPGGRAHDHFPGLGQAAQAGRRVHSVAGQRVVAGARVAAARDDEPGVDAGVHGQRPGDRRSERGDERVDRAMQLERRAHGAAGVVAMGERNAKQGHHLVADELIDGAAVPLDDGRGVGLDP